MPTTKHTRSVRAALVLLACLVAAPACSVSLQRATAVATEQVSVKLLELRDKVEVEKQAGRMAEPDYKAWKNRLGKIGRMGQVLVAALAKADGQEAARQIDAILEAIKELVDEQVVKLSPNQATAATIAIEAIRSALMIIAAVAA